MVISLSLISTKNREHRELTYPRMYHDTRRGGESENSALPVIGLLQGEYVIGGIRQNEKKKMEMTREDGND